MHLRRRRATGARAVIDGIADVARRREIAEQAADATTRIAANIAKRSADLTSQAGERVGEVAHAVSAEGRALMEQPGRNRSTKKPRKPRLRHGALLAGVGAVLAYFLDPENGSDRRAAARRRISHTAQVAGDGLDKAAHVAHQTAEATGEE